MLSATRPRPERRHLRQLTGAWLAQDAHRFVADRSSWRVVTRRRPSEAEWADAALAWRVVGWVRSNGIVLVAAGVAWGIGAGQQNRVEAGQIAAAKAAGRAAGGACASDAFYPFPDGIEAAAAAGVAVVIQPGALSPSAGWRTVPAVAAAGPASLGLRADAAHERGLNGVPMLAGEARGGRALRPLAVVLLAALMAAVALAHLAAVAAAQAAGAAGDEGPPPPGATQLQVAHVDDPACDAPAQIDQPICDAELQDLELSASQRGLSLQAAINRYAWHDNFALAMSMISEAFPRAFTGAEIVDARRAWVAFAGGAPEGALDIIDLFTSTSGVEVEVRTGSEFTEAELQKAIPAVHYAVLARDEVRDAFTSFDSEARRVTTVVVLERGVDDLVLDDLRSSAIEALVGAGVGGILDSVAVSVTRSDLPTLGGLHSGTAHLGGEPWLALGAAAATAGGVGLALGLYRRRRG